MATGSTAHSASESVAPVLPLPRLEQGDRLTRAEFERRYEAMPEVKKEIVQFFKVMMVGRHEWSIGANRILKMDRVGPPHQSNILWQLDFMARALK